MMRQLEQHQSINIVAYTRHIRRQRCQLVQTLVCNTCLNDYIITGTISILLSNIV